MAKKFTRTIEDFICEHCGNAVKGSGYTNHCPKCLWSKHVDINPGDRKAICGGMMQPIFLEQNGGQQIISHQCVRCGFLRKNKVSPDDDFEVMIGFSALTHEEGHR